MKTCKDCQRTLPLDRFTKVGARPGKRAPHCLDCFNALKRAKTMARAVSEGRPFKPRVNYDPASGVRQCRSCETQKPIDAFATGQRECRECRSGRYARYRREHADAERERHRRYYQEHREALLAFVKRWRLTPQGRESARVAARKYWHSHTVVQKRVILLGWHESRYANAALRRARIYSTRIERIVRSVVIERDARTCHLCGRTGLTDRQIHIDHVVPLSRGGTHTYDNVRVACVPCNYHKSNRLPA
jgi:5-methylcytosine-specific restriction endonuclease McrA